MGLRRLEVIINYENKAVNLDYVMSIETKGKDIDFLMTNGYIVHFEMDSISNANLLKANILESWNNCLVSKSTIKDYIVEKVEYESNLLCN
jgi:hypothetical protein